MTLLDDTCGASGGFSALADDATEIKLEGAVVRQYTKEGAFGGDDRTFCGKTPYTLTVQRTQTKSTLVSVAHPLEMEYDAQVIKLEHEKCANPDEYKLLVDIEVKRRFLGGDWSDDLGIVSVPITSDNVIRYEGACKSLADVEEIKSFSFHMYKKINGLDYTGMATVQVELKKPDAEDVDELLFSADSIQITCSTADGEKADFSDNDCSAVAADANIQLDIAVIGDEAQAFDHTYSMPVVSGLGDADGLGFEYRALVGVGTLADKIVSEDHKQVQLRALPFAGQNQTVTWTVTRTQKQSSGRRLRQVVTYMLGADGSVTKSAAFAVAPAVRESGGAAAVGDEVVEHITETGPDENGTVTRTTTVVKEDKSRPRLQPRAPRRTTPSTLGLCSPVSVWALRRSG